MKMNLCMICKAISNNYVSLAEFTKDATKDKASEYRDFPSVHVTRIQAALLYSRLFDNGLHVVGGYGYLNISGSCSEQINDLIDKFCLFKIIPLILLWIILGIVFNNKRKKNALDKVKRRKIADKKDMSKLVTGRRVSITRVRWMRKIWNLSDYDTK
ncbi:MAG: hypothetical protein EXX96DRAFT_533856 [Benjaminiella poitrasii]|nr:MAG: hypothetical protein EXX96DRAFT_533856 [Benjaminiella poitrasii]